MEKCMTVGLDIAKRVFHVLGLDTGGKQVMRKKLYRSEVLPYFAQLRPCRVGLEGCAGAHYWARELLALGHQVSILPPKAVKAYLRAQKNDYNDAHAIAEAAHVGMIRPVAVKTIAQQDEQALQRIRQQLIRERTALCNQIRGLLNEYGVTVPQGIAPLRERLVALQSTSGHGLTPRFIGLLGRQYDRLCDLDGEIRWHDQELSRLVKQDEVCRRLMELPGFGVVNSAAFKAWVGDGKQFCRGRDASAALGIVPRQYSTGGKPVLLGITKRGDGHLRSLIIHGARSVVRQAGRKTDPFSCWINDLVARRGTNKATVAVANKLVRMAWVLVARGERYQPLAVQIA